MVGDTLEKDIYPALEAGLQAIWLNAEGTVVESSYEHCADSKQSTIGSPQWVTIQISSDLMVVIPRWGNSNRS